MSSIGSGPGIGSGPQYEVGSAYLAGGANAPAAQDTTNASTDIQQPATTQTPISSQAVVTTASGAGSTPIDSDRVVSIKQAIANGTYQISPSRIADAMIGSGLLTATSSQTGASSQ